MSKYALNLDQYIIMLETTQTLHYGERAKERLHDKLKILMTDGIPSEYKLSHVTEYISKKVMSAMTSGIIKMDLPSGKSLCVRSGRIAVKCHDGMHYPIFKEESDGKEYTGDEFVTIVRDDKLVTVKLMKHHLTNVQIGLEMARHEKMQSLHSDRPVLANPKPYLVIPITSQYQASLSGIGGGDKDHAPNFLIDLTSTEFKLFSEKKSSEGIQSSSERVMVSKELTFPPFDPGRNNYFLRLAPNGMIRKYETLEYTYKPGELTIIANGEKGKAQVVFRKDDVAIVKPAKFGEEDLNKVRRLLGDKFEEDKDYSNALFKGKIYDIGIYSDKKMTYTRAGSKIDLPLPYIRINADEIVLDTE